MSLYHHGPSSSTPPHIDDSLNLAARPPSAQNNIVVESTNWDLATATTQQEATDARGYPGQYLVGLYDPATGQVTLHASPLLNVARNIQGSSLQVQGRADYAKARRDLGEAFGNRKQKLAMRNADRMKVDTTGMAEGVLDGIATSVTESTAKAAAIASTSSATDVESRPIPTPHLDAPTPDLVYPLSELFPSSISSNINPSACLAANDAAHIKRLLPSPMSRSQWLSSRIWNRVLASRNNSASGGEAGSSSSGILKTSSTHQKQQTRLLLFISYLASLRALSAQSRGRILNDRKSLREKLKIGQHNGEAESEALIDSLLAQFCERDRAKGRASLTPFGDTKLLATILALCLHVDGFQIEVDVLAAELGMAAPKLKEVAKSIGCTARYRQVGGGGDAEGEESKGNGAGAGRAKKFMVLKCPVTLPEPSTRGGPPARR